MAEAQETQEKKSMAFICIDGSEFSDKAFDWYCENIHKEGDEVGLIHVHVPPDLPSLGLYGGGIGAIELYKESVQETIDASRQIAGKFKDICTSRGIKCHLFVKSVNDSIGHTICNIAKSNDAAIVVIGQRGLGAIRRTLFGSVSDYVLHHTHIPVVVIPPTPPSKE